MFFCYFRFDARDKSRLTYADHFSPIYGQRASMRLPNSHDPKKKAVLVLSHLRPEDEGIYKCRADFKRSPTKNNRMFLNILSKSNLFFFVKPNFYYKSLYLFMKSQNLKVSVLSLRFFRENNFVGVFSSYHDFLGSFYKKKPWIFISVCHCHRSVRKILL